MHSTFSAIKATDPSKIVFTVLHFSHVMFNSTAGVFDNTVVAYR